MILARARGARRVLTAVAVVEPEAMAHDGAGEAVLLERAGAAGGVMAGYLSGDVRVREGASLGGSISRVRQQGQQLDNALLVS